MAMDFSKVAKSRVSNRASVNHVVAIEDGLGRYMMGNIEVDIERLRMTESKKACGGEDEKACAVCGGKANGIHFKIKSCPACNAFFRRSVVENRKYICRSDGNCDIGKEVRCICRACRLKKCILAGMDPKAVQPHRDSIGRKLEGKTSISGPFSDADPSTLQINEQLRKFVADPNSSSSLSGRKSDNSPGVSETAASEEATNAQTSISPHSTYGRISSACSTSGSVTDADGLVEQGLQAYARLTERRRLIYGARSIEKLLDGSEPEYIRWKGTNHYRLMNESYAIATANLIEFVKAFPAFCTLSIADQMALVKHFCPIFVVFEKYYITYKQGGRHTKRIYRQDFTYVQLDVNETSMASEVEKIIQDMRDNKEGYFIPAEARTEDGQLVDDETLIRLTTPYIHYALEALVKPMEELQFTDVEFICSALGVLFDPGCPNLSPHGQEQVKRVRNQLYTDWFSYYETLGDNHDEAALKIGNTILIMPIVDTFVKHNTEVFHLLRVFGIVEYDKLLDEFFNIHTDS